MAELPWYNIFEELVGPDCVRHEQPGICHRVIKLKSDRQHYIRTVHSAFQPFWYASECVVSFVILVQASIQPVKDYGPIYLRTLGCRMHSTSRNSDNLLYLHHSQGRYTHTFDFVVHIVRVEGQ